jgi:hypothetical protein
MSAKSDERDELAKRLYTLPDDTVLNVDEVALYLGVTPSWVRSHANRNRRPHLPGFKAGKYVRFRLGAVRDWVRRMSAASHQSEVVR